MNSSLARADQRETNRLSKTVMTLARVEWEYIQRVVSDCEGNISQSARLLGLHRRSLQRKLGKGPPR
jgi:two-component system response regulator RegA